MDNSGFRQPCFLLMYYEGAPFINVILCSMLKRGRAAAITEEVISAVKRWPDFAEAARISDEWRAKIQKSHRLTFALK